MKFLILTQYFPPEMGAAPTRLAAFVRELKSLGHEIEIVTAMPNYPAGRIFDGYRGKFYKRGEWEGCKVHHFWIYASQGKALGRLLNYLSFTLTAFFGLFVASKPDVVFVNSAPLFLSVPGWIYSLVWRSTYIFSVSDIWPRSAEHIKGLGVRLLLKLATAFEKWSYARADYINALTEGIREYLLKERRIPAEKVLFLPNGVDTKVFFPRPENEGLRRELDLEGKKVIVYPGNHGYLHALHKVLEAAELLMKSRPDVHFLFVGGGSEKPRLLQEAKERNLSNVTFLDPVSPDRLAEYIELATIGLIHIRNSPLANETRPAKMIPLMAMKKPILYAGFGEGAELIKKIGGGVVIPMEQPELLCETIEKMVADEDSLNKQGQSNFNFASSELNTKRLVENWLGNFDNHRAMAQGHNLSVNA